MKRLAPLALLLGFAPLALAQGASPSTFVGKPLPKFAIVSTKGERLTNASLKGKVVLLDFWATWCGPCKAASPAVQKIHDAYGAKGLRVIGADTFETGPSGAAKYAKEHGYTYTFGLKGDGLATAMGATGIPLFVLVDKKGIVRNVWLGIPRSGVGELYGNFDKAVKPLL